MSGHSRRAFVAGLGGMVLARAARAAGCEVATTGAISGPFVPTEYAPTLFGDPNPGERRAVAEHDADLAQVTGAARVAHGQIVEVEGEVLGRDCRPLAGARVAIWQADANGRYNHENERSSVRAEDLDPAFGYWGHVVTGEDGRFRVRTIVPKEYAASSDWYRPPHLHWSVRAEGLPELVTQTYFEGDVLARIADIRALNAKDLILNLRAPFDRDVRGDVAAARSRAREELVVAFAATTSGPPKGRLRFVLAA